MGGFLAVRSVIAAWRRSVGELSGHAAIRLLLHITRFGTYSLAVPDLSLDPDEFAVAAQNAMVAWVRRIAELPADESASSSAIPPQTLDGQVSESTREN